MGATHITANVGNGLFGVALASAAGATVTTTGPIGQVFNETGALMAIMGALGGVTKSISIIGPDWNWWLPLRRALYGASVAFGFQAFAPIIASTLMNIEIGPDTSTTLPLVCSAYALGYFQDNLIDLLDRKAKK